LTTVAVLNTMAGTILKIDIASVTSKFMGPS
jgi:hypothetical protein